MGPWKVLGIVAWTWNAAMAIAAALNLWGLGVTAPVISAIYAAMCLAVVVYLATGKEKGVA